MKKQHYNAIDYNVLRLRAKTGDALLFANTTFVSRLIRHATDSDISHIGFIVRDEVNDLLLIMESTKFNSIEGSREGVQISLLSERLKTCGCRVYHRPLEGVVRDEKFNDIFKQFRREMKGKEYERNYLELIASAIDWKWLNKFFDKSDLSTIFCSELYAEFLRRIGVLSILCPYSNEFTPANFSIAEDRKYPLIFKDAKTLGVGLGEQRLIVHPDIWKVLK